MTQTLKFSTLGLIAAALLSTTAMAQDVPAGGADPAPTLAEIAASDPALELREGEHGEPDSMVMLSDVLFEFGDATIAPESAEVLKSLAPKLKDAKELKITGHTDDVGSEAFNRNLGQLRADAVRSWLVENGDIPAEHIIAVGLGEANPIAANQTEDGADNPAGRSQNRRVEFSIAGDEAHAPHSTEAAVTAEAAVVEDAVVKESVVEETAENAVYPAEDRADAVVEAVTAIEETGEATE